MRAPAAALALLVIAALSGCVIVDGPPAVSARDVRPTGSVAGEGRVEVRFLATDEPGGPPLPGVTIAVSHGDGALAAVLTDASGRAVVRVPEGRALQVSAWREGWTEERTNRASSQGPGEVVVPLFRERLELELPGRLSPAGASTYAVTEEGFQWEPRALTLGAQPGATPAYLRRLVEVTATLEWVNAPTGAGDLALAGGDDPEQPDAVQDAPETQAAMGPHEERVTVPFEAIYHAGWRKADQVFVGPGTTKAFVAPLGLDYLLTIEAEFDGDLDRYASPGATTAALVALAAAAFILPRRAKRE